MKGLKISLVIMAAALLTVGLSGMAYAFHSGGVADCDGCHTMHGVASGGTLTQAKGSYLLQGSDASSTCLGCHANAATGSYHIMTYPDPGAGVPPVNYTPGGDFGWLAKAYSFTVRGTATTEFGQTHGHNINAKDFGMLADTDFSLSPGGTFPSASLGCNSCHDPHGKYRRIGGDTTGYTIGTTGAPIIGSGSYNTSLVPTATQAVGSYRLLAGAGYSQDKGATTISYPGVPIAIAPSTYNQVETANQVRVAYGYAANDGTKTSWGNWCGNATCHSGMNGAASHVHPVDVPLGGIGGEDVIYGKYISSGNMNGTAASSYLSLVPFSENSSDYTFLKGHASNTGTWLAGPATDAQVNCMSCHRAHASGFPHMMRWNMENEFMVTATDYQIVGATTQGRTHNEAVAAYYGRDPIAVFGAYQRVLCNKCHAQD